MSSAYDEYRITDGLGQRWTISENCFKVHACCGHTHTAIDTALALRSQVKVNDVATIVIDTYQSGFDICKEMNPRSPYQAKFSIAYCVAVALLEGRAGLEQFSPERFSDAGVSDDRIVGLLQRTRVVVADDLTSMYPAAWPARVRIEMRDGTVVSGAANYPRGNPENPVSTEELERKFRSLVAPRFDADTAERAIAAVRELPACTDLADLFPALFSGWTRLTKAAPPHVQR
jgi:2-methylcitrate dehydratase PrpD